MPPTPPFSWMTDEDFLLLFLENDHKQRTFPTVEGAQLKIELLHELTRRTRARIEHHLGHSAARHKVAVA